MVANWSKNIFNFKFTIFIMSQPAKKRMTSHQRKRRRLLNISNSESLKVERSDQRNDLEHGIALLFDKQRRKIADEDWSLDELRQFENELENMKYQIDDILAREETKQEFYVEKCDQLYFTEGGRVKLRCFWENSNEFTFEYLENVGHTKAACDFIKKLRLKNNDLRKKFQ
eukprot:NODE_1070_length_2342_cov_0.531431.p1 type:complete len:171 gc:universal NODE_1070_length_2342_cov_0.531431:834-1346(+)